MSAQTPQTEVSVMSLQMASDHTIGEVIVKLQVERDHYKALCEELREAIIAMGKDKVSMGALCSQVLVRSDLLNSALRVAARTAFKKAQKP